MKRPSFVRVTVFVAAVAVLSLVWWEGCERIYRYEIDADSRITAITRKAVSASDRRGELKEAVAQDLIDGNITFAEAIDCFTEINSRILESVRQNYQVDTDFEASALAVIKYVRTARTLESKPDEKAAIVNKLEAEFARLKSVTR